LIKSIGIGIIKTISISNTIKMTANKKNRIENGIRALWFGSNPHSKGEDFSRSEIDRMKIRTDKINKMTGITIAVIEDHINIFMD
jgi:hypothetical protein